MKLNKKGFTLIELLAVIVVTSLVLGLSSYGILKTYNKSKEKVIVLNEASILEAARIQSSEANSDDNSKWRTFGDTSEVFCTTIQRLKNAGLLKKEATSEEHGDDAIITVERNNTTFNVTNTSFLDDDDTSLLDLCNIKFYTIHYEYNVSGESDTVPKDQKREVSQPTNLSSYVPQRKGYLFVGWNSEPNGTGIGNYSAGAEFAYDSESTITLYAQWQLNTYTINYYLGNNTSTKGATLIGTSKCTPSDKKCSLTRWESLQAATPYSDKGWTFAGWSTNKDSTNVNYIDGYTKSFSNTKGSIIKLYAIFTRNVKFYSGENSATIKEEKQYYNPYYLNSSYYTSVTIPSGASISGWSYNGYITVNNIAGSSSDLSAQGKSLYTTSIRRSPTYEPKLYAIYQRTLTLKFNKNNGSGTVSNITQKQYYNTGNVITTAAFTLPENGFTRSGYTFSGWNTKADGTGTTYAAGSSYSLSPSVTSTSITKTLYARWTKNCSIIFNSNSNGNATGTMQPIDYQTGNTVTLSSNNYTWTGHTFKNWNTKADGTGTTYADGSSITPSSCGITLYAQWQDNTYTITFSQNGASSIGTLSKTCVKDEPCDLPSITRNGYEIIGWGTSSDSKTAVSNPYTGNSDITLYAITKKTFSITYDKNGSGFTIDNPNVNYQTCTSNNNSMTCTCDIYNTNTGCKIKTPKIGGKTTGENGYFYSTNPNESKVHNDSSLTNSLYAGAEGNSEYINDNTTYYIAYTKREATFKPNGAKLNGGTSDITKNCITSNGGTCSITAPTITRDNYTILGYNTTSGATTSVLTSGGSKTLESNTTYYAITKKAFTINYSANNSGLPLENLSSCTGTNSLRTCTCDVYNTNAGCAFTTPEINGNTSWDNGYYYSLDQNESNPYSGRAGVLYAGAPGNTESVSNNVTYYVAYKKVSVTFKPNGAKLDGGTSDITKTCITSLGYSGQTSSWNNKHTKCSVTAPIITRDNNYTIEGYNTTSGATSGILASGGTTAPLDSDTTYYAITRPPQGTTMYVSAICYLRCRKQPNENSDVVINYSCGDAVNLTQSSTSGWYYDSANSCYMSSGNGDYLKTTKTAADNRCYNSCYSAGTPTQNPPGSCSFCRVRADCMELNGYWRSCVSGYCYYYRNGNPIGEGCA